jgi:hypothetical protein
MSATAPWVRPLWGKWRGWAAISIMESCKHAARMPS